MKYPALFPKRVLTGAVLAAALFISGAAAQAQEFGFDATGQREPDAPTSFEEEVPSTGAVNRGLINGIARGGLTMLSPTAPAYYGDGRAYVSTYSRSEAKTNAYDGHDETGEWKGLKFFSREW